MYDLSSILGVVNIGLNAVTIGAVLGIWRIKVKYEKAQALINTVGPVPPVPTPTPPMEPVPIPQPKFIEENTAPPSSNWGEKPKKVSPKVQKQIDLLTSELERLKAL